MPYRPPVHSESSFNEENVQSNEINSEISSIFYTQGSVGPQPHHPRVPNELPKIQQKVVLMSAPQMITH